MAIPADLWLGTMFGSVRRGLVGSGKENEVRGEWVVTYYVTLDVDGYSDANADAVIGWIGNLWQVFPGLGFISGFVHRDKITALHFLSEQERENTFTLRIGTSNNPPVPMQAAALVIGRAKELRHQTRRWLPGVQREQTDSQGRPQVGPDWPDFTSWMKSHVTPAASGGRTVTPVIWNQPSEELREITEVAASVEWRTQRRRTLTGDEDIITI